MKTVALTLTSQDGGLLVGLPGGRHVFVPAGSPLQKLVDIIDDPGTKDCGPARPADFIDDIAEGVRGLLYGTSDDDTDSDDDGDSGGRDDDDGG